jgi:protein-tyrosine phosphatase
MIPRLYKLTKTDNQFIAIMGKLRQDDWLEDEIKGLSFLGVDIVVSLLQNSEVYDTGLEKEEFFCVRYGIEFISFPIKDRYIPDSLPHTVELVKYLHKTFSQDKKSIAIHCRAGIGRSSLIAACLLILDGENPETVYELISEARGLHIPDSEEQSVWLQKNHEIFSSEKSK